MGRAKRQWHAKRLKVLPALPRRRDSAPPHRASTNRRLGEDAAYNAELRVLEDDTQHRLTTFGLFTTTRVSAEEVDISAVPKAFDDYVKIEGLGLITRNYWKNNVTGWIQESKPSARPVLPMCRGSGVVAAGKKLITINLPAASSSLAVGVDLVTQRVPSRWWS